MEQHVCRDLEKSAYAEVLTVFSDLLKMEQNLEEIGHAIGAGSPDMDRLIERQSLLNDTFLRRGGLTAPEHAALFSVLVLLTSRWDSRSAF